MTEDEDRYRIISELTSDFAYAFAVGEDGELTAEWVTGALERISGWTWGDLAARGGWEALIHPDDLALTENQYKTLLFGEDAVAEYRIVCRDGSIRWVRDFARPEVDPDTDQVVRIHGAVQDISEWKRTLDALLVSELRFRQIVERAPFPIAAFRTDDVVEYLNPRFTDVFGYTLRDVPTVGDWMRRAFPDEVLRRRLSTVWSDALGEGDAVDLGPRTFTIRCADGTDREIDMRIFGPGSGRFYVMAEDLSERIRAERERQELELRMQQAQKLESLGVLAGGIAHDFNNLLVGILGYADLARSRMPDSEPNAHLLDQIQTAGRRLSELTAQLLAYSGKGQFVVKAVDLGALVREMAHLLEVSLSKRAHLHYEFTPALPAVSADATQLRQVVMNLITNASDALGDAEGTIHLRTGRAAVDEALLAGAVLDEGVRPGEYVYLEVEDSGPGMDAETAARIFDPFYTTKFAGRGLGLASVLGIVRGHGGTIVVDSRPGEGTRVRVLLPVAVGAAAEDTPQMDAPVAAVGGTVLVVDDDATVRDVAGAMLRQAGYEVVEAADARQALQRFDEARPAVVLLDLTMPENDGQHPYDALRARDPDVPIVLCSGYGEQVATERFAEREDTVFLPKPFVVSALLRALEEAMGG